MGSDQRKRGQTLFFSFSLLRRPICVRPGGAPRGGILVLWTGLHDAYFRDHLWHNCGMSRTRLSTTVDAGLLESARRASGKPDSALVDEALAALLARHRSAEVDASYAAYDAHPLDEPDEWGDLASFRRAVAAS